MTGSCLAIDCDGEPAGREIVSAYVAPGEWGKVEGPFCADHLGDGAEPRSVPGAPQVGRDDVTLEGVDFP